MVQHIKQIVQRHDQNNTARSRWRFSVVGYIGGPVLLVGAIFLIQLAKIEGINVFIPGALTAFVIVIVALLWGTGPGIVVTLLGTGVTDYYSVLTNPNLISLSLNNAIVIVTFLAIGLSICAMNAYREQIHSQALLLEIEARRQMDEFVSIASHELKTPLTGIKGTVQFSTKKLKTLEVDDTLRGKVQSIERMLFKANISVDRFTRLVNDMLDMSRLQTNQLHVVQREVDLASIFREFLVDTRLITDTHPLEVHIYPEPLIVMADVDRIIQVTSNFLSNAFKYSQEYSPVYVSVDKVGRDVRVTVVDQGIGISPEECKKIWNRFYRAQGTAYQTGLGLGLYISSVLIQLHKGKIGVESELGKGSTFWFQIPLVHKDVSARRVLDIITAKEKIV